MNARDICVEDHADELVATKLDAVASSMLQDHQPTPPAGAQAPAAAQRVPPVNKEVSRKYEEAQAPAAAQRVPPVNQPQQSEIRLRTGSGGVLASRSYHMTE